MKKKVKSGINRMKGGEKAFMKGLPVRYSLNTYIGCSHCCAYCYNKFLVRFVPEYKSIEDVCQKIIVKENLAEVIEKELAKIKEKSVVWIGSTSDPYQPIEIKYEITRKSIEIFNKYSFPFSIYTKSNLVVRDLDLLKNSISEVIFTITSIDDDFKKKFEPLSPSYDKVLESLEKISRYIDTRVAILPIIPEYNDNVEELKELIKEAKKRGARNIFIGFLRLSPLVIYSLKQSLKEEDFNRIYSHYGEEFAGAQIPIEIYRKKILKELFEYAERIKIGFYAEDPLPFYKKKYTRIDKYYYATYQDFLFYRKKYSTLEETLNNLSKDYLLDPTIDYSKFKKPKINS